MKGKIETNYPIEWAFSNKITIPESMEWVEADIEGDAACPTCGERLILIPALGSATAFCLSCKKQYVGKGE